MLTSPNIRQSCPRRNLGYPLLYFVFVLVFACLTPADATGQSSDESKRGCFLFGKRKNKLIDPKDPDNRNKQDPDTWVSLGPFSYPEHGSWRARGIGRMTSVVVHPQFGIDSNRTVFATAMGGGLWKSIDGGLNWDNISDHAFAPTAAAAHVAIAPSDDQWIYLTTGANGQSVAQSDWSASVGVLISADGGKSWQLRQPDDPTWEHDNIWHPSREGETSAFVAGSWKVPGMTRVVVDPRDARTAYVAASFYPYYPQNQARPVHLDGAVYMTRDGGRTWRAIHKGICHDLELKPDDPSTLYVSGKRIHRIKGLPGNIKVEDITDRFVHLDKLVNGKNPDIDGPDNLIQIEVTPAAPELLYSCATMTYRRDKVTRGTSVWRHDFSPGSDTPALAVFQNRSWTPGRFHFSFEANHYDPDAIYLGWGTASNGLQFSANGGKSWRNIQSSTHEGERIGVHDDINFITVTGADSFDMYVATDGGISYCADLPGRALWEHRSEGLRVAQFFGIDVGGEDFGLSGGTVDCGIFNIGADGQWHHGAHIGDAYRAYVHPNGSHRYVIMWSGGRRGGRIEQSTDSGKTWSRIPNPPDACLASAERPLTAVDRRPNWLYTSFCDVFLWDISKPDSPWQKIGQLREAHGDKAIDQLAVSPSNPNVIYASVRDFDWGENHGVRQLFRTRNALQGESAKWVDISPKNPTGLRHRIRDIEVHPNDPNRLWIVFDGYRDAAFTSRNKVLESKDGGASWQSMNFDWLGGEPFPIHASVFDAKTNTLYIGTDIGVFYTDIDVIQWARLGKGLPYCHITQLEIHEATRRLVAATYGRGIWSIGLP